MKFDSYPTKHVTIQHTQTKLKLISIRFSSEPMKAKKLDLRNQLQAMLSRQWRKGAMIINSSIT